jgi:hypothetical protein
MSRTRILWACLPATVVMLFSTASPTRAVLFYSTGNTSFNTAAPTGSLTNTGWELQGLWGAYLGTPIAPRYFLSARHVGGAVGDPFFLRGIAYTTTAAFDDSRSDLRIWQVDKPLPAYAQLYTLTHEVGQNLVVFGRGTQRGAEVWTSTPTAKLHGWQWGPADGRLRWGQNRVTAIADGDALLGNSGAPSIGELLQASFNAAGGTNEAHLSNGDSAGGIFVHDGVGWKLAGINYASEGFYSVSKTDTPFSAALFDEGGLYRVDGTNRVLIANLPSGRPGAFFATRVSVHLYWIRSFISKPLVSGSVALQSATGPMGPFTDELDAQVDLVDGTVTVPLPGGTRFFRLTGSGKTRVTGLTVRGSNLVLSFAGVAGG